MASRTRWMWSYVPLTHMMSVSLSPSRMARSSGFSRANLSLTSCLLTCQRIITLVNQSSLSDPRLPRKQLPFLYRRESPFHRVNQRDRWGLEAILKEQPFKKCFYLQPVIFTCWVIWLICAGSCCCGLRASSKVAGASFSEPWLS